MTTWGVGAIPFNMHAKLEHDEDLAIIIRMIRVKYAKAFKGWKINGSLYQVR
jgi:hypothetical protein